MMAGTGPIQKAKTHHNRGITTVELMIATSLVIISTFSVSVALVDGQRGWNKMYNRIYSDVVNDAHIARRTFDTVVRKSSSRAVSLDSNGQWVEVCYYADSSSSIVDRYARFFRQGNELYVEYCQLNPKVTTSVQTVCGNVSSCIFKQNGRSLQMLLTLDNGSQELITLTSAVVHN